MKKIFNIIITLAFVLCASCNFKIVKGSGKVVSEEREVSTFHAINLKGSMDVEVTQAGELKCTVQGDDNIVPLIATEVRAQRLHISAKQSYSTRQKLAVLLEVPEVSEVVLNGSGDISIADVTKDTLLLRISGSGDILASGRAKQVTAEVDGSGDLQLAGLVAEHVNVTINGSGDADVYATVSVNAKVNGSGDITYSGNPEQVNRAVRGSGDIVRK